MTEPKDTSHMTANATSHASTDFVPADLDASQWPNLEPLYQALLERDLACENCLEKLILDRSELDAAASEAAANLYISMTRHTDNEDARNAYLSFIEHVEPKLKMVGFELDKKIAGSDHAGKLDKGRYGVLLRDMKADVELFRDENVPLQTQDTKLGQQYSEICGAMTVEFDGEERTLPQMARYMEVTDRSTREAAWRSVAERRHQDHDKISGLFDQMISLRKQIAANAGFDNYRDYMFKAKHRFDYTPKHCEDFHKAAEEVCVPLYRTLNAERKELLGVDALRPWDLAVDVKGRDPLRPFEGADELVRKSSALFHNMPGGLGDLFDRMREGDCLDLESRKGKAPGGYQYQRDRSRQPFIFMNAAGLGRDVEVMIHEAGHAFHSMLSEHDPLVGYRHSPIEFAEVASISMELLAFPYLGEFYDEEEANRAKREQLAGYVRLLPWIATIDAFQHWLYLNPDHTRDQRAAKWLELDERFGAAVDWTGLEDYRAVMWHRQLHLFEVPFYYIEYGIAQLGALQLWLQSLDSEQRAIDNYRNALSLGGSKPLPELFGAADLKFDFGPDTTKRLMDAVQGELEKLPA